MSALLPSVTFLETRILHSSLASEPTQALAAGLAGTSRVVSKFLPSRFIVGT